MKFTQLKKRVADRLGRNDGEDGFTLIELLVVILIIGILAAIAIPIFLGQQNSAKDSAVKSDLASAKIAVIGYATQNGSYLNSAGTALTSTDLSQYGFAGQSSNTVAGSFSVTASNSGANSGSFCISEQSATLNWFKVTATGPVVSATGPCTGVTG
jgi:prepilin-type N-terminal cleavage/methylation domain-containing protein